MFSTLAATWLGGRNILHTEVNSEMEFVRTVRAGLPTAAIEEAIRRGKLSEQEVAQIIISRRMLAYRKKKHQALSLEESDRLARVARIMAMAEDTFQDADKSSLWMRRPNRTLHNATPLELLDTDGGARLVEQILGQIAHGVYS